MKTFEERLKEYNNELLALNDKYKVVLYPSVVLENGEIRQSIKIRDVAKVEQPAPNELPEVPAGTDK